MSHVVPRDAPALPETAPPTCLDLPAAHGSVGLGASRARHPFPQAQDRRVLTLDRLEVLLYEPAGKVIPLRQDQARRRLRPLIADCRRRRLRRAHLPLAHVPQDYREEPDYVLERVSVSEGLSPAYCRVSAAVAFSPSRLLRLLKIAHPAPDLHQVWESVDRGGWPAPVLRRLRFTGNHDPRTASADHTAGNSISPLCIEPAGAGDTMEDECLVAAQLDLIRPFLFRCQRNVAAVVSYFLGIEFRPCVALADLEVAIDSLDSEEKRRRFDFNARREYVGFQDRSGEIQRSPFRLHMTAALTSRPDEEASGLRRLASRSSSWTTVYCKGSIDAEPAVLLRHEIKFTTRSLKRVAPRPPEGTTWGAWRNTHMDPTAIPKLMLIEPAALDPPPFRLVSNARSEGPWYPGKALPPIERAHFRRLLRARAVPRLVQIVRPLVEQLRLEHDKLDRDEPGGAASDSDLGILDLILSLLGSEAPRALECLVDDGAWRTRHWDPERPLTAPYLAKLLVRGVAERAGNGLAKLPTCALCIRGRLRDDPVLLQIARGLVKPLSDETGTRVRWKALASRRLQFFSMIAGTDKRPGWALEIARNIREAGPHRVLGSRNPRPLKETLHIFEELRVEAGNIGVVLAAPRARTAAHPRVGVTAHIAEPE